MNIPNEVKIGGKTYRVETTSSMNLGIANVSAEISYQELIIRVSQQAKQKMESDFLHEVMHGIFDHLGQKEQDEILVDQLAQSIYMVIQDNPALFIKTEEELHGEAKN